MFKMASEDSERVPSNGDFLTPGCRDDPKGKMSDCVYMMKKKTHSSETSRCRHFLSKVTRVSELRAGGRYCSWVLSPYSMTLETFGTYVNRLSA
jgi:hypothetical protein